MKLKTIESTGAAGVRWPENVKGGVMARVRECVSPHFRIAFQYCPLAFPLHSPYVSMDVSLGFSRWMMVAGGSRRTHRGMRGHTSR